jgi:hypothetical protein
MASYAFHPPIHLKHDPDRAIRSLEEAMEIVRAHPGPGAEKVLHQMDRASSPEQAEAAGRAFRAWAEHEGLLLIPPEDKHG